MFKKIFFVLSISLTASVAVSAPFVLNEIIGVTPSSAVHFPGGLTNPLFTYNATVTAGTNVDSVTTPAALYWMPVSRNHIRVFGTISVNATNTATATNVTLTLPKTRSANFSGTDEAYGWAGPTGGGAVVGSIISTDAAKTVKIQYVSSSTNAESVHVDFVYEET